MIKIPQENIYLAYFYLFICQLIALIYAFNQLYFAIVATRSTLELIPGINPHIWPFFLVRLIAIPYLKFWEDMIPPTIIIPKIYISEFLALNFLQHIVPKILINCENYFYRLYFRALHGIF